MHVYVIRDYGHSRHDHFLSDSIVCKYVSTKEKPKLVFILNPSYTPFSAIFQSSMKAMRIFLIVMLFVINAATTHGRVEKSFFGLRSLLLIMVNSTKPTSF
jgi:hypothetical protein